MGAPADTRERILAAALHCFLEAGYERTTIARIREVSGASNGALFHHFASKEAIADTLYVDAIASYQQGVWKLLRRRPRSLRAALRAAISHQLSWTEQNADLARFVYMRGHLEWDSPGGSEVAALNSDLAAAVREWTAPLVEAGEARQVSTLVLSSVVGGPAHVIARRWLAGHIDRPPTAFVDELTDAAWAALRGSPVASRRPSIASARQGRVTVELLGEDGRVLARGEASASLAPASADA